MKPSGKVPAPRPVKGRGALSNAGGRFESHRRVAVDDGWDTPAPPAPRTTVTIDCARTIIARNSSPDVPFDQSVNPYRGCEHGCVYCYARPSHAYLGLSPGLDFETRLYAKPAAATLLRRELGQRGYRCRVLALGTNTDPYQPTERRMRITRSVLEVLAGCRHPVTIVTKSALIERDLDILGPMGQAGLAAAFVSITTLDAPLARRLEPRAAAPRRRLETLRRLHAAGVPAGVLVAPVIPALTDGELEGVLEAAAAAGARAAGYVLLRLPGEVGELFRQWLAAHAPLKAARVMALLRQCRDGREDDPRFGRRMRGAGPYARLLEQRFSLACSRLALDSRPVALDTGAFRPPGGLPRQGALFE